MKKIRAWIGIVIIAVLFVIWAYLRPHEMEKEYNSTIYSNESNFERQTNVMIKGKLYKRLFDNDEWIGNMTIDNDLTYEIKLKSDSGKYFGLLTSIDENMKLIHSIGSIMMSKTFNKVWIQLNEINERYDLIEGYISGPAKSIDEANKIARLIIEGT